MKGFYNCCQTLKMKTKSGDYPLTVFCVSHGRGPGKTYSWTELITDFVFDNPTIKGWEDFERILFKEFFAPGDKFVLVIRKRGLLGHAFDGVFKKMLHDVYPNVQRFYETTGAKNVYTNCIMEYYEDSEDENGNEQKELVKKHVGYVVALNAADDIKLVSSMFTDVSIIFIDEFQPTDKETYLPNEISKFKRIYKSIARGGDENELGVRRVPCVFVSNTISIQNPYFVSCGLWNKIQSNTMKYIGDNYVFHRIENNDITNKHKEEGIDSVFADDEQGADDTWINDNNACVVNKIKDCGEPYYDCTLIAGNNNYGVKYYPEAGIYFIDNKPDMTNPMVFNLFTKDMKPNLPAFKTSMRMIRLRKAMLAGNVFFKNEMIKSDCLNIIIGGVK